MTEQFGTFNWNDLYNRAKAVSFEPLPPATYHFEVVETSVVTTSTGKPMIKIKLAVVGGPRAGTKVFDQFVLSIDSEKALAMFFLKLKAFGLDERFFATIPSGQLGPIAQALFGKHVQGKVKITTWNEQERNEVESYSRYVGSPGESVLAQSVAALSSPHVQIPVSAPVAAPVQAPVQTATQEGVAIPINAESETPPMKTEFEGQVTTSTDNLTTDLPF